MLLNQEMSLGSRLGTTTQFFVGVSLALAGCVAIVAVAALVAKPWDSIVGSTAYVPVATFACGAALGALVLRVLTPRRGGVTEVGTPPTDESQRILGKQITAALGAAHRQNESAGRYKVALIQGQDRLTAAATTADLRSAVRFLTEENSKMVIANDAYRQQIKESADQIQKLRAELDHSQEQNGKDALTHVSSRRHFDDALEQAIVAARDSGGTFSLVMVDIDKFKRVNDTFGHLVGDSLLKQIAHILTLDTKGGDIVARFGGEEFAIILPAAERKGAMAVAERIRRKLEKTVWQHKCGGRIGTVTASFGVAQFRMNDSSASLIERADSNLYRAKNYGRNLVSG